MDSRPTGERAGCYVREAPRERHVRENKMGRRRRDVDRKAERANHQGHVQDSAANAEEARHEANPDAVEDAEAHVHGVLVGGAGAIAYRPSRAHHATHRLTTLTAPHHKDGRCRSQEHGGQDVEEFGEARPRRRGRRR